MPCPFVGKEQRSQGTLILQQRVEVSASKGLLFPSGGRFQRASRNWDRRVRGRAIRKGWRRWGSRAAPTPGGCERPLPPNIPPGGRVHMASPRQARPPRNGGQVWPFSRPVSRPDHPENRLEVRGLRNPSSVPPYLPSPCSWFMVTVRLVTGDRPPAAGAPKSAFTTGGGAEGGLQAKSRRRRCWGSGPSSMAAPGLRGLPLPLPPLRLPRCSDTGLGRSPRRGCPRVKHKHDPAVRGRGCRGRSGADGRVSGPSRRQPHARVLPLDPRGQRAGGRAPAT